MSDYISREALIGKAEKHYCDPCKGQGGDLGGDWCRSCVINSVLEKVRGIPAADVEPMRRGEWLRTDDDWNSLVTIQCSACGGEWCFEVDEDVQLLGYNYCPGCGCKMDLEDETNDD